MDVKQLLRACYDLMVVRLPLLDHDHVDGSYHAACNFSSLRSRVPAQNRCICLYVGCRRLSAFAVTSVWAPTTSRILVSSITGSGRPGGALNGSVPSSSVSSDSQDAVGVSHGFLSLGSFLRAGSVRISLRNISSSSRDTPSRAPSLFQPHGSVHDSVH